MYKARQVQGVGGVIDSVRMAKKAVQVFLEIEGEKIAPQGFFSKVVSGIFSFQFAQQRGPHKRAPQAPGLHPHGIGHAGEDLWID